MTDLSASSSRSEARNRSEYQEGLVLLDLAAQTGVI
jgi:hypothetical protein